MSVNVIMNLIGLFLAGTAFISKCSRKQNYGVDPVMEHQLLSLMLTVSIIQLLDLFGLLFDGIIFSEIRMLLYGVNALHWLVISFFSFLCLKFTDYYCYEDIERLNLRKILYSLPMHAEFAIVIISLNTGWLFTMDDSNRYQTGNAYELSLIPFFVTMLYSVGITFGSIIKQSDKRAKRKRVILLSAMFLPACGIILDALANPYGYVFPFVSLSLLMILLAEEQQKVYDEKLRTAETEKKVAEGAVSGILSQVQPNFLYKSLSGIEELCEEAPELAQVAVGDFSKYLRGNLDSLRRSGPVSFESELKHTELFLSLYQKFCGNELSVEYDVECTKFLIPGLTLQPLVENAVKYSIGSLTGKKVTISSREFFDYIEICVFDTGTGYDINMTQKDGRTGIGILNVRERLSRVRNASLVIEQNKEGGMTAVIRIPKEVRGEI